MTVVTQLLAKTKCNWLAETRFLARRRSPKIGEFAQVSNLVPPWGWHRADWQHGVPGVQRRGDAASYVLFWELGNGMARDINCCYSPIPGEIYCHHQRHKSSNPKLGRGFLGPGEQASARLMARTPRAVGVARHHRQRQRHLR